MFRSLTKRDAQGPANVCGAFVCRHHVIAALFYCIAFEPSRSGCCSAVLHRDPSACACPQAMDESQVLSSAEKRRRTALAEKDYAAVVSAGGILDFTPLACSTEF